MRIFDLDVAVAAVEGYDELVARVVNVDDFDSDLYVEVESEAALETQVMPTAAVPQIARLGIFVEGIEIPTKQFSDEITVTRDYDNLLQGWTFTTPLEDPDGVFGDPFTCYGPGLGLQEVTLCGLYNPGGTGEIVIPLITGGSVDNSTRESGPDGIKETFTGVDRGGQFDGTKITVQFPPGHGLPRGRVLREIFTRLGETQHSFVDGGTMMKELQLVDAEPLGPAQELMETENRKILWDSEGFARNPKVGPIGLDEFGIAEEIAFTFEEKDVLQVETVTLEPQGNVVTLVIANGTEQMTEDECAHRVEVNTVYDLAQYTPQRSLYRQNVYPPAATYTATTPPTPNEDLITFRKTETTRKFLCEEMYEELVKVWEWRRNEIPRWIWDDDGGGNYDWRERSCYTDDNDGIGSQGPAYEQLDEVFQLVSETRTFRIFAHEDFSSLVASNSPTFFGDIWDELLKTGRLLPPDNPLGWPNNPRYGQAVGYITLHQQFNKVYGAIKRRSVTVRPYDEWQITDPVAGDLMWGEENGCGDLDLTNIGWIGSYHHPGYDGPGVIPREGMMPFSATVGIFNADDKGYLNQETKKIWGHRARRGYEFYYGENDTRKDESERFQLTDIETITYVVKGTSHSTQERKYDAITGRTTGRDEDGIPGDRPAVERLDVVEENDEIYEGEEIDNLPKVSRRKESKQVSVTIPFDFLLTCHWPREVVTEFPWAENSGELREMAEYLVKESAAMPVRFTLPANFLIREGQAIHFTYRPLAIDHDMRVKSVQWTQTPGQPLLTNVECRLYPW